MERHTGSGGRKLEQLGAFALMFFAFATAVGWTEYLVAWAVGGPLR